MPIYEFECRKCKAHIEVFQKVNDKHPTKCRKCGGRLEKLISAPAIQFKGSGWYVTDYSDKSKRSATPEGEGHSGDDNKAADKKSKETSPTKKTSDKASSTKPSGGD
jgi:putative FmdB family regulatory protein